MKAAIDNGEEAIGIDRRERAARTRQIRRQIVTHAGRRISADCCVKMLRPRIVRWRLNVDRGIESTRRRSEVLLPSKRKCRVVIRVGARQIEPCHLRRQTFDLQTEVMLQRELDAFFQRDGPHHCIGRLIRGLRLPLRQRQPDPQEPHKPRNLSHEARRLLYFG